MTELDAIAVERYRRLLAVYASMVGILYPQMAYRELVSLWHECGEVRKRWGYPLAPRADGSAPRINTQENAA